MTDNKKPRTPRELAPGKAIALLKALKEERDNDIEDEAERAKNEAMRRVYERYEKRMDRVLSRVHGTAREGVAAAAGVSMPDPPRDAADDEPEIGEGSVLGEPVDAPTTTEAANLPRGAQPMDPDRAARVERMAGRGAR